jgi:ABC-2 type transport system permease protein
MRALLIDQTFRADLMIQSFALNILMFGLATVAFLALLASARRAGSLMQTGE